LGVTQDDQKKKKKKAVPHQTKKRVRTSQVSNMAQAKKKVQ